MKNIKKFYKEHRVFTILMSVVIVCLVLIVTVLIQIFYSNGSNKYGDRLEQLENNTSLKISESKEKDFEKNIINGGKVTNCDLRVQGKIVYITMQFNVNVDLEEAKGVALKSLETFSEEELATYDFVFTLKKNTSDKVEGFLISGARNKNGNGLSWNNNRQITEVVDDNSTEKGE